MSLLLDAYNVLHCSHVLPQRWAEVDAVGLCRLIDRARPRGVARVVCDGAPPRQVRLELGDRGLRHSVGAVELIYAGGGKDADSLIEQIIEDESSPRQLVLVSNDRRVQAAARRRGAAVVASEEFLRGLVAALRPRTAEQSKPTTEPDADYWVEQFGLETGASPPADLDSQTDHWLREFGFAQDDDR